MNGKINCLDQICSVRKLQFYDGRENGEHIIEVENGVISFTLLQDRCLDIHGFKYKGTNISFMSKNGLVGFESDFGSKFNGGMLYTCGLDTIGGRQMPIHGRIHNIPATVTKIERNEEYIEIVGEVRQSGLFGENLLLRRSYKTMVGSGKLHIRTEIINEGFKDEGYCLLLHMNVGYPMLDKGTEIIAPVVETEPRNEWSGQHMKGWEVFEDDAPLTDEYVFFHKVSDGNITVVNKKLNIKLNFKYDKEMLPYFIEWKSLVSGAYSLGIEPATTTLEDKFELKNIKAGEKHTYDVELTVGE